jgi:sterol O-acyltransferase
MHSLVMLMKMHSYTSLNGDLSIKLRRLGHVKKSISEWVSAQQEMDQGKVGGWGTKREIIWLKEDYHRL